MFHIHRIDRERFEDSEQLGTKRKFWFTDADRRLLFKAEERGTGEDWAEKVACHLCELLGLPRVQYELAEEYDGPNRIHPGVICEMFVPEGASLILGNQLMLDRDPNYPADKSKYKVSAHTVHAVAQVTRKLAEPPLEWIRHSPPKMRAGLDFFVGYVMLDAWIANQDRHHENWGAVRGDVLHLAPTFDHGASLARNLSDAEREDRLLTRDQNRTIAVFARRARSAFYGQEADSRALGTSEAFAAFARLAPEAARIWLDQLAMVGEGDVQRILDEVPNERMSRIAKDFTLKLLQANQRRLLEELAE